MEIRCFHLKRVICMKFLEQNRYTFVVSFFFSNGCLCAKFTDLPGKISNMKSEYSLNRKYYLLNFIVGEQFNEINFGPSVAIFDWSKRNQNDDEYEEASPNNI